MAQGKKNDAFRTNNLRIRIAVYQASAFAERLWSGYETPSGNKIVSADAILRLLPWRERMVLRGTMASPLNQGFCTRNPLDCFQPEDI